MRLIELVIMRADSVVRRIPFKQGLNLILDRPTPTLTESGNNVGKTTVLRLVDFCLGSDGDDIWQDSEFKKSVNREVYDYLHGKTPVSITLSLENEISGKHTLTRHFVANEKDVRSGKKLSVDGLPYKKLADYKLSVKELLFGYGGTKPSLRQLVPKFVRSSQALMSKTLKYLGDYGSEADYEALHLFLFGFFEVHVLEERPRLTGEKKRLERDLVALNRMRKEGEIEQLLIHLRREIEEIGLSRQLRGEVPEIAARANVVSIIRAEAEKTAGILSRYDGEIASIRMTIDELKSEYGDIDQVAIESIYREAQNYIPKLHHDWKDLAAFIQNLRGRKERFLESQAAMLQDNANAAKEVLLALQAQEKDEIGALVKSPEFEKALELRGDLQEKLKKLGSLEQDLKDLRDMKAKIAQVEKDLLETKKKIEDGKALLRDRVGIFNKHFSELSKVLYGEQYLLTFDETDRGSLSFELTAVGSNVGAGKKVSQTAAFDVAYIRFLIESGIRFPRFVCHDGIEGIHGNQLTALLMVANQLDGQLILAVLRDKLPSMPENFVQENTILELAQDDKLFHL
jgi:uncharacterized protein YydD (DUF2326 family)